MIDRKMEPFIRRKMTDYLGELEDDDLILCVVEHLKDRKGPGKLVEELEPVRLSSYYLLFRRRCSILYLLFLHA